MRRVLAVAVLLAFMPTANAQDKGKADFSHNAEFRVRDTFEDGMTGMKAAADGVGKPSHHNGIEQRFKFGLGFKASEKFAMTATLLQASQWGQAGAATPGNFGSSDTTAAAGEENFMSVNEAFGTWMMSEDFNIKFGRMNFGFGDGAAFSVNDWEQQPVSFEGLNFNYEAEFGRFHVFSFKVRDLYTGAASTSLNSDPQQDAYGLVFDLKTMPEWLKNMHAYAVQTVMDPTAALAGGNELRYGLGANFMFAMVDLKAHYANVTGKSVTLAGAKTDVAAGMMQAEVGFNMSAFMGSRFFAGYYSDTGNKSGTAKNEQYSAPFSEQHESNGLMDILTSGNLTDMWLGWTLKPMDNSTAGIAYHMFSKTVKDDGVNAGKYGGLLNASALDLTQTALGSEIDLWAEHNYGGGFTMTARLGQFMPGKAYKDATVSRKDAITQAMLEARLSF